MGLRVFLAPLLDYIIRPCFRRLRLFPDMWRRKHNRRRAVSAVFLSSRHASRGLFSARSVSRLFFIASSSPRLCLLALYALPRLVLSPRVPLLPVILSHFSSSHRFASCLVSSGSPSHRQAGRGGDEIGGGVSSCGLRRAAGGSSLRGRGCLLVLGWRRAAGGCGGVLACL